MIQRHTPLGYKISNGKAVIVPETAAIVKNVFNAYLEGASTYQIAKILTEQGIQNASHKPSWNHGSIGNILENRKYLGDDFYPPMIDKDMFEQVQKRRIERKVQLGRTAQPNSFTNRHVFSGKLRCGECGQTYRRYVEHCNQAGEKIKWKCKQYIKRNRVSCQNLFLTDDQIAVAFLEAINKLISMPTLLERRRPQLPVDNQVWSERISQQIREKIEGGKASAEEIKNLVFERARQQYQRSAIDDYEYQTDKIRQILAGLDKQEKFDSRIFEQTIQQVVIYKEGKISFQFINGIELDTYIES